MVFGWSATRGIAKSLNQLLEDQPKIEVERIKYQVDEHAENRMLGASRLELPAPDQVKKQRN